MVLVGEVAREAADALLRDGLDRPDVRRDGPCDGSGRDPREEDWDRAWLLQTESPLGGPPGDPLIL